MLRININLLGRLRSYCLICLYKKLNTQSSDGGVVVTRVTQVQGSSARGWNDHTYKKLAKRESFNQRGYSMHPGFPR